MANDNESQRQQLLDFQLQKDEERASRERLLESEKAKHKNQLEWQEHQMKIQKITEEGMFLYKWKWCFRKIVWNEMQKAV